MGKGRLAILAFGMVLGVAALGIASFGYLTSNFGAITAELPEPSDEEIAQLLRERLARAEERLSASKGTYDRWCHLGDVALGRAIFGDAASAEALADELLALAPSHRNDWNYGNAIHYAHLAKGHVALRSGDRASARRHLLEAGNTPGSPQLDSFGPRMSLAREFLRAGERDVVLVYIASLRRFWKMDSGALAKWSAMISEGRTPNLAFNL